MSLMSNMLGSQIVHTWSKFLRNAILFSTGIVGYQSKSNKLKVIISNNKIKMKNNKSKLKQLT